MAQTILGKELTPVERQVLDLYAATKRLLETPDLPPCARSNLRVSLAALWQVVNDLDLAFEPLYEYGV